MSELDAIKDFFKTQFEKYAQLNLEFRYEYDALTEDHIIEVSNEDIFQLDDFQLESFEFTMNFIEEFQAFILFLKPSDPIHIGRVDYSENNFYKNENYSSSQIMEGYPILLDKVNNVSTNWHVNINPKPLITVSAINASTKQFYVPAA